MASAAKHRQLVDFTVTWFDKHYSPSKEFRKRELENNTKTIVAAKDNNDRFQYRLDQAWEQKFSASFGKLPGTEVPDRRAQQSIMIKKAGPGSPNNTWHNAPSMGDTWGTTWPGSPKVPHIRSNFCQDDVPTLTLPDWPSEKRPSTNNGRRHDSDSATPSVSSPSAASEGQSAGLVRASSAPTLGIGPLFGSSGRSPSGRSLTPSSGGAWATSNMKYGWIETPPHLAYKPHKKTRSEEVIYKQHMLSNKMQYSPRIRFTNSGGAKR